jgi:hypothetical protein
MYSNHTTGSRNANTTHILWGSTLRQPNAKLEKLSKRRQGKRVDSHFYYL